MEITGNIPLNIKKIFEKQVSINDILQQPLSDRFIRETVEPIFSFHNLSIEDITSVDVGDTNNIILSGSSGNEISDLFSMVLRKSDTGIIIDFSINSKEEFNKFYDFIHDIERIKTGTGKSIFFFERNKIGITEEYFDKISINKERKDFSSISSDIIDKYIISGLIEKGFDIISNDEQKIGDDKFFLLIGFFKSKENTFNLNISKSKNKEYIYEVEGSINEVYFMEMLHILELISKIKTKDGCPLFKIKISL